MKGASTGAPREPDEAINAQLELEDRFDWAFARGQHFAEPATQRESEGASSDAMYEEFEELIEETRPVQEPEDPRIDALQDDAWPEIPQGRFVVRREVEPPELLGSSGLGKRKGGAARKSGRKGVPPWLSIALILVLILAGVAVWVLLRSLDAERTVSTVEDELEELAESPSTQVDVGPTPVGDTGPDFEVPDLDVVASRVPEQDPIPADAAASPLAVAVSKPTAAKPAQPDRSATPSGASIPADAGTVPGAASAEATDPKESKRAWEPLVRGVDLPGWQSRNRDGWSVRDDLLTVRPPPDAKSATVLVTDRKYRNLAFTFKAKPLNAGTVFGVLTRAQSGAAIRLEFSKGKGTLRAAEASMAVDWEWKPNVWHQVALIAMDKNVLVYIDRRKVGTLSDVKVDAAGRLGVYCSEGQIELRAVYAQPLD